MIHIEDTLRPQHVILGLRADTPEAATEALARRLAEDERVVDWEAFHDALLKHPPCRVSDEAAFGVCIPHARTGAVSSMVLAAARLENDTPFPECEKPVRYVFTIGVPQELAADYLRLAGLLMRVFTDPVVEESLRTAATGAEFVEALESLEVKL